MQKPQAKIYSQLIRKHGHGYPTEANPNNIAAPMARLGNITTKANPDVSDKWGNCNCDRGTWGIYLSNPKLGTGTSWYSDRPAYGSSTTQYRI